MPPPPAAATAERDSEPAAPAGSSPDSAASPGAGGGTTSAAGNAAFARALENGGYFIDLGPGLEINPEDMSARVNLEDKRQVLPGVHLRELVYEARRQRATVRGDITIPHLRSPRRGIQVSIDDQGRTSLDVTLTSDLPVFKNKTLQVTLDEQRNLAATLTIEPTDLMPARSRMSNLTATGGGTFHLAGGKLSGNLEADLAYANLGAGHFTFNFTGEGRASGSGNFDFSADYLNGASASLAIDENANLTAEVGIPVTEIQTPIPGLSITEGTVLFTMDNSTPGGGLEAVKLVYNGFGEATINASIRNGLFTGNGNFAVTLPELTDVRGNIRFQNGVLTGDVTIRPNHFPRALQVREGSITVTLTDTGDVNFNGEATIALGPAGTGQLRASRENGLITIGTTITLENIPGLQSGSFSLTFTSEGTVEGEADIATDDSLIPGLTGTVHVEYRNNLWSGETEITYTRDDPTITGSVTVGIRQTEEGALVTHGEGELTVEIIPGVEGMAGVVIDEEGNVVLNFAITQTEPYELFPERRQEREFLNVSRNIPLWAGIVVAVIRIRAGARAGVGPGQIRNSRFEGTWEITSDEPPDFSISSEFYMPAFVEGYVAFGAGLGVDVLLGSLTGGIEAMATAGLYGAVSVVPRLSYEDGDWLFNGTATLAAGARLKLSLNAWAEIEALWVTVWERTWELASHTMPIGPDLVLRAAIDMNLSNPSVPEITFEASDTDNEGLIDGAMPEDGPPSAGTREALENRAEWSGPTQQPGADADSVPPEQAAQANETEPAPAAPPRPPDRDGPPAGEAVEETPADGAAPAPGSTPTPDDAGNAPATSAPQPSVTEDEIVGTEEPRYPRPVSLASLDEPPAPMPRTVQQENEDLQAANRVLDLAANQTENSEQLAAYFPRIQRRFQLTFIGYEKVGDAIAIRLSINPSITAQKTEQAKGSGITGIRSEINYTSGNLHGGHQVGAQMEAEKLGPDYPPGRPPADQMELLNLLPKDTSLPNEQKFIRGHLLNHNIGGEGSARNLFPITAAANRQHLDQVENRVKNWVDSGYWVYYRVNVVPTDISLSGPAATNYINSRFECRAHVWGLDFDRAHVFNAFTATIVSRYQMPSIVGNVTGEATDGSMPERREGDITQAGTRAAERDTTVRSLNAGIKQSLSSVIMAGKSWDEINAALSRARITHIGDGRIRVLRAAYLASLVSQDISSTLSEASERASLTHLNNNASDIVIALNAMLN